MRLWFCVVQVTGDRGTSISIPSFSLLTVIAMYTGSPTPCTVWCHASSRRRHWIVTMTTYRTATAPWAAPFRWVCLRAVCWRQPPTSAAVAAMTSAATWHELTWVAASRVVAWQCPSSLYSSWRASAEDIVVKTHVKNRWPVTLQRNAHIQNRRHHAMWHQALVAETAICIICFCRGLMRKIDAFAFMLLTHPL